MRKQAPSSPAAFWYWSRTKEVFPIATGGFITHVRQSYLRHAAKHMQKQRNLPFLRRTRKVKRRRIQLTDSYKSIPKN
jgi:hypothetical protein